MSTFSDRSRAVAAATLCLGVVWLFQARAEGPSNPPTVDLSQFAKVSDLTAMQSSIMSAMPLPADMAPQTDATAASIGTANKRFMLQDSVRPARYRSSTCTLAGGTGTCSLSWSSAFAATPNALGDPAVINANGSTSMIQCNFTAISAAGASVKCVQPLLSLTISLGALTLLPAAPNGLVVSATAVQPL